MSNLALQEVEGEKPGEWDRFRWEERKLVVGLELLKAPGLSEARRALLIRGLEERSVRYQCDVKEFVSSRRNFAAIY